MYIIFNISTSCNVFFVFCFFDNCVREKDFNLKNLITCAIVISISMLFSFFISKLVPQFLYDDLINRANLTSEFLKKTLWFFHQPLMNSIANYNINPSFFYKIISIIIVIIGLYSIYNKKHGGKKLLLTLLLAVSSYVPNLVVEESWAAYRSLVSLELIMTSVFIIGIFYISDKFKINHVTYPTIIILVMFFSFKNILKGFVIPQILEFRLLYNEIAKNVPQDFSGNLLFNVKNSENKTFSDISDNTLIGYDEFGQTSMIIPFATPGMAEEIKSERKMSYKYAGSITNTENIKCDENCIIIDVTKIIEQNKSLK
ncbi:hypothetical protein ArsFIN_46830 (plasmid) [Arsenophonus nasoniae]|uniref:Glucosyl transferase GtrII n=1 Tax=Arsenophonus nasoniae TaxID=638 RepID=A0A4P7LAA9_9GAMM|nr:hypothetical protein ArsFIN_46830 [Arsenophonus nasoniae]